jgi:LAS superfamily LD-carboxypeptidase LdcB
MRSVYDKQVQNASARRPFVDNVADADLEYVEKLDRLRRPAAADCRDLLTAARADLAKQKQVGDAQAGAVTDISLASAYRSASQQFSIWQKNFPTYYRSTGANRGAMTGGEHGPAAVALLAGYISNTGVAAPGYSLHNNGLAVDFSTTEINQGFGPEGSQKAAWKRTWLWAWLTANASTYHFFQDSSINEPWHWVYRATSSAST